MARGGGGWHPCPASGGGIPVLGRAQCPEEGRGSGLGGERCQPRVGAAEAGVVFLHSHEVLAPQPGVLRPCFGWKQGAGLAVLCIFP